MLRLAKRKPAETSRETHVGVRLHGYGSANEPAASMHHTSRLPQKLDMTDVVTDKWVSKMFSIISSGPSGGFVRYAIDARNRLVVEKTGNRSTLEDVVSDVLPSDSCRYVAYSYRYRKGGIISTKVVWFLWTPSSAPEKEPIKYTDGLASTLIGLNVQSSIPILKGNSPKDLAPEVIMHQI